MVTAMPPAETEIGVDLVRELISDQRPDLGDPDIRFLAEGWDNASFRVGDDLVARLPRREPAVELTEHEVRWLPRLAPTLPIPVPAPVFVGEPGRGYPWRWTLVPWLPGRPVRGPGDVEDAVGDLGEFLRSLHRPAPDDAPWNPFRSIPLRERHEATVDRINALAHVIDAARAKKRWEIALEAPPHQGEPCWIHGDLHPRNVLASDGRVTAVIDFGDVASGDPATDLSIAWMLFKADARSQFAESYSAADPALWDRAAGWALTLATAYLVFSADNPTMGEIGTRTIEQLLDDPGPASPVSG